MPGFGEFPVNDANAVKIWSKNVEVAEREFSEIAPLIGTGDDAIIWEKNELEKGPGDQVKFNLRAVLQGPGFTETDTAEGNGEELTFSQDSIVVNELGHTTKSPSENTIDAQRVPFNIREQGRDALGEWYSQRKADSVFGHFCGYTPYNTELPNLKKAGLNTITAPAGGAGHIRIMRPAAWTDDQSITSNDTFTTALIDRAKTRARMGINKIKPVMVGGKPKYVMYISDVQVEQLRTNSGTGGWLDIQKAALMGAGKHGIYDGALGEWNGVVLRQSASVTFGVHSGTGLPVTNVRRAVLLGRHAAVCAYGRKTNPAKGKYRWSEELKDHGRRLEMGVWGIWGVKKAVFQTPIAGVMTPVDFGTLVVSTWAPDPVN